MSTASPWYLRACAISVTKTHPVPGLILGVDPGLRRTGYGLVAPQPDGSLRYVASGVIVIAPGDLPTRLHTVFAGLSEVITLHKPELAVIEQVFVNVNPQSTLLLGQARGAAIAALTHYALSVFEYTALQVKQALTGRGKADKIQVQAMVRHLLNLSGAPQADAADALACAICHAHSSALQLKLRSHLATGDAPTRSIRGRRGRLIA